ncbi:hypothetical protein J2809_002214 [Arthrobacter pascens]|uniref:hypothetical protein n=1 Tax=Arthrobacter pascens TaxID=1677 RepID=UPI002856DD29|nr:hypothetical protein [Arthrobacter pascens]MDR6557854.1 hypothetical protein [Arthrobacter pascens]
MAKKSRRQPARRNSSSGPCAGKPVCGSNPAAALASLQSAQELNSLIPAFVCWHWEHAVVSDVPLILKQLNASFSIHAKIDGDATVTAIEPEDLVELVGLLIEHDSEFAVLFCGSLYEFVHFLMDTGRWSGTAENYQTVRRILFDGLFSARFLS